MSNMKKILIFIGVLFFSLTTLNLPAQATISLNGEFIANQSCEAFQSFNKRTNPGNITLTQGKVYQVIGKNKNNESHYLLQIEDANPTIRWVAKDCGQIVLIDSPPITDTSTKDNFDSSREQYLLALSWQPAFCESRPYKIECKTQTENSFSAKNLVLHGLWPQPISNIYCNVSDEIKQKPWSQLPAINLTPETREELAIKMPGYASYLHRHEWYKHGTCYSETAEEYYKESMALLDQINESDVRDLLVSNINKKVNANEIRAEFDDEFDNEAGDKVKVSCNRDGDRTLLSELWINLTGEIELDTSIEDLMENAPDSRSRCSIVIVDPVGNQ